MVMKPKKNQKANASESLGYDRCQTPAYAVAPLLPYLFPDRVIWEPAAGEGYLVKALKDGGCQVVGTDILQGAEYSFFNYGKSNLSSTLGRLFDAANTQSCASSNDRANTAPQDSQDGYRSDRCSCDELVTDRENHSERTSPSQASFDRFAPEHRPRDENSDDPRLVIPDCVSQVSYFAASETRSANGPECYSVEKSYSPKTEIHQVSKRSPSETVRLQNTTDECDPHHLSCVFPYPLSFSGNYIVTNPVGQNDIRHNWSIITNPPYSIKFAWLEHCYDLGLPFALLVPVEFIGTKGAQRLMERYGAEIMLLDKRVNFKMPEIGWGNGKNKSAAQFPTLWLCHGILPSPIVYGKINYQHQQQLSLFDLPEVAAVTQQVNLRAAAQLAMEGLFA